MTITEAGIRAFFREYEAGANSFDPDLIRSEAAKTRLSATPTGVDVLTFGDDYRERIAARHAWLREHGYVRATISALEVVPIDRRHALANTTWDTHYQRPDGEPITIVIHVSYVLRQEREGIKVLMYISHEDETELLTAHGILESAA